MSTSGWMAKQRLERDLLWLCAEHRDLIASQQHHLRVRGSAALSGRA